MADDKAAKPKGRGTRPRRDRIEVWVTPDEKADLSDKAAQAGLSLSAYMRAVGLHEPIRSVADLQAVGELGKVNGDLGRVAGLLKLWLAEKRGEGAHPIEVEGLMKEFRLLQSQVLDLMGRVMRDR
ncbi:conjugal transfer protein TraJ [Shinella yambaruensis]|uniref:CopG family transcriptional regulator n=1 Tax=Shinella yambaruensis TaxID=415996 RepID=A0ABQ5ZQQ8_9HYPH|nr:conjugal transfer protein TraJ [Shinella yambaruensis]MCJ8029949.1 conjugal transfer protein TraJ [Shinella yambaruensis]MCU7984210.1 conjugal transfer protein TraJ [Shinella yambaruensis]GLR55195.1 CopG family transcriptional regulator [Shinella yambaruensis]